MQNLNNNAELKVNDRVRLNHLGNNEYGSITDIITESHTVIVLPERQELRRDYPYGIPRDDQSVVYAEEQFSPIEYTAQIGIIGSMRRLELLNRHEETLVAALSFGKPAKAKDHVILLTSDSPLEQRLIAEIKERMKNIVDFEVINITDHGKLNEIPSGEYTAIIMLNEDAGITEAHDMVELVDKLVRVERVIPRFLPEDELHGVGPYSLQPVSMTESGLVRDIQMHALSKEADFNLKTQLVETPSPIYTPKHKQPKGGFRARR